MCRATALSLVDNSVVWVLLVCVTIETALCVDLPGIGSASSTPPIVFDRTPSVWRKASNSRSSSGGQNFRDTISANAGLVLRQCPSGLALLAQTCDFHDYTCDERCGKVLTGASGEQYM
ncbi:hypothetical protein RRG08_009381 [Elysia crispata]|uniref:Secreted protein n=1 Tax=Elysia crispata TaxID=231223 RepID=A0AAE1DYN9_9GAST|nr:hypothetical protein RRG08_009381 [Elysia crispata]